MNPYKNTLSTLRERFGSLTALRTNDIYKTAHECGYTYGSAQTTFLRDDYKVKRGVWDLSKLDPEAEAPPAPKKPVQAATFTAPAKVELSVGTIKSNQVYIPTKAAEYVPWGEYTNVATVIKSKQFFPLYISGLSGNGKTFMVEQACARMKREYIRIQINPETDEDAIVGGFRLLDGETVFQKGPLVKAMESGAILLVDEIDRASNKAIFSLLGALEGKPILLTKIGEVVHPQPGFNIIATANTKGRGSETGQYAAAQVIDDAFLERFVAHIDQKFPSFATERKILTKASEALGFKDDEFVDKLTAWSAVIRKTFESGGVDEVVSTRRLCHILKSFSIFRDRLKAVKMCITRFDEETSQSFLDLYTKIDATATDVLHAEHNPEAADTDSIHLSKSHI